MWDKHPDEQVWYAKLPEIEGGIFKRGYTILPEQSHFSLYDGFGSVARVLGRYVLVTEAKEAAHADQLVADMAQPVTPQEAARVLLVDDKGERLILAILGYEEDPSPAVNWIAARNCRIEDWRGRMIAGLCAIAEPPQEKDE
jgi:hypothetical protein